MFSASKNSIKNEQLPVLAEQVYIHLTITLHWYYRLERAISIKQQYFLFRNYTTRFYLKRKHVPTTTTWARNNSLWAFAINCNRIYYKAEHRTWVEEKLSSIRFQLLVTTLIHYLQFCRLLLNLIWACEELQLTCSEYPHMCLRQHFCSSFNPHCRPKVDCSIHDPFSKCRATGGEASMCFQMWSELLCCMNAFYYLLLSSFCNLEKLLSGFIPFL